MTIEASVEIVPDFLNLHDPFVYNRETDKCYAYFEISEAVKIIRELSLSMGMPLEKALEELEIHNESLANVQRIIEEVQRK
ncbi:hypothetical protein [Novibacillus thermophilus]|uniref:Uncharacterized protein n=1 Tax=Novibacillus thermophilus TaxID=1471761 RepID=A0A1U9KAD8_9BACL|nr:hypothetical protein [Novibacillus thermophilus]AQS56976.1 hypothetical protein B0W44_15720 [Novibacillus thermophilus]